MNMAENCLQSRITSTWNASMFLFLLFCFSCISVRGLTFFQKLTSPFTAELNPARQVLDHSEIQIEIQYNNLGALDTKSPVNDNKYIIGGDVNDGVVVPKVSLSDGVHASDNGKKKVQPLSKSIFEILDSDHRFSKLMTYVLESEFTRHQLKNSTNDITIFAPTNAAFALIDRLYPGKHFEEYEIENILQYHMIMGKLHRHDLFHGRLIQSLYKEKYIGYRRQQIRVQKMDEYVILNRYCKLEEYDIPAANGLIHVVNCVLIPPPNMFEELSVVPTEFSITTTALLLTGLDKKINDGKSITFFAPNNLAWQSLGPTRLMNLFDPGRRETLRDILLFHMSPILLYSFDMAQTEQKSLPTALLGYIIKVERHRENSPILSVHNDGLGRDIVMVDPIEHGGGQKRMHDQRGDHVNQRVLLDVNKHPVVFHDGISKNGNIHIIERVLCPCDHRVPTEWKDLIC